MRKRIQLNHFVSKPYNVHVHLIQNINTHLNWKYASLLFAFLIAVFLRMYEVLPTEPLHYIKEHISNVVTEIVAHLSDEEKALCWGSGMNKRPTSWFRLPRDVYSACQTTKR